MRKVKVLQLTEDLRMGGLEKVIADISQNLDKEKYSVEVWCVVQGGEIADELKRKGVAVRVLDIRTYHNPLNILKLAVLLKKARTDIIHTHGYLASTIGRIAARIAGVPIIIMHLHTLFYNLSLRNRIIDRVLNLFTHKIICVSEAAKESFIRAGYRIEKSIVIYNGIDEKRYAVREFDDRKKIIVIVASLYPHKGHTYLLKAMRRVLSVFPEAGLWIVGDGPLRQELEKEAADLGISSRVSFLGKREDVPGILFRSSIFALTSLREGLPLAVVEAVASGLPVVASDVGGIAEVVIDKRTGLLVPPGNEEALAKAMVELLGNPRMMREMGQGGRKVFEEKFTNRKMISELDNVYQELLGRYHGKD